MEQLAMFVLPVLVTVFVFGLIKSWMDQRSKARSENVRLLEEALKNPSIDRATVESLAYQLTGARTPKPHGHRLMAMILALGWLTLFSGVGVWVLGELISDRDTTAGGVITSIIGFGLVTYPFALRELEARRAQN